MKKCEVNGCTAKRIGRGWCFKHYMRWRRHGDHKKTLTNRGPATWEFLLSRSKPNNKTGCIEWQRGTSRGYGKTMYQGVAMSAHRVSYLLNVGEILNGLQVLHRCDNKPCINPDHLFLGTHQDNIADRDKKGRQVKGEDVWRSKLVESDIREIREMKGTQTSIAKKFDISQSSICRIKARKEWKHVL